MRIRANEWQALLEKVASLETQVEALTEYIGNGGSIPQFNTTTTIDNTSNDTYMATSNVTSVLGWGSLDQSIVDLLEGAGYMPSTAMVASDEELRGISGVGPATLAKIRKELS